MLNKIVSIVLLLHYVILIILTNIKGYSNEGQHNKTLICATFVTFLYMMVVLCNKTLTSVGGVPTSLLFGISFICTSVKLLVKDEGGYADGIMSNGPGSISQAVMALGGIASVVSIILGLVLTFSSCKK
jgi:hypothetical protein